MLRETLPEAQKRSPDGLASEAYVDGHASVAKETDPHWPWTSVWVVVAAAPVWRLCVFPWVCRQEGGRFAGNAEARVLKTVYAASVPYVCPIVRRAIALVLDKVPYQYA